MAGLTNLNYADFTLNALGQTAPLLTNPYVLTTPTPFQCAGGIPTAVNNDGSQVPGTPCNLIPTTGGPTGSGLADPIGLELIQLYPTSGIANVQSAINYANVPVRQLNEGNATIKLDHNFSSKDSAFARFSYDQANSYVPGGSPTWAEQNPFGSNQLICQSRAQCGHLRNPYR